MADDALTDAVADAMWERFGKHPTGPLAAWITEQDCRRLADTAMQVVREHTVAQVAAAERDRDEWRARRDRAIETCRFRHQDGLTAEEWHTRICGAMQGAQRERARAERAEAQVAAAKAEGWAACVLEAEHLGWMHDLAADDMAGRNPYRAEEQR